MKNQNPYPPPPPEALRRCKTMTIIQIEATECGAVCLGLILAYMKRFVSIEELRQVCGVSRNGSSAYNILLGGENYGLKGRGYHCDLKNLYTMPLPAILHWEEEHFVVLEGFAKDGVYLNDPARGPYKISYPMFIESYSNTVIVFEKTEAFAPGGHYPSFWDLIVQWIRLEKSTLAYVFLTSISLTILELTLVFLVKIFTDQYIVHQELFLGMWIFMGLLFTSSMSGLFYFMESRILNRWNTRLSIKISAKLLWKMIQLPLTFYTQRYPGEIAYRMILVEDVAQTISGTLAKLGVHLLLIVIYGFVITLYNPLVAAVVLVFMCSNVALWIMISRGREDPFSCYQAAISKNHAISLGGLQAIETIKATGSEFSFFSNWAHSYTKVVNHLQDSSKKDIFLNVFSTSIHSLLIILVLMICLFEIVNGQMTIGTFLALNLLIHLFLGPVDELISFGQNIQLLKVDMMRLSDILSYKEDPLLISQKKIEANTIETHKEIKLRGYVALNNVSFSYSKSTPLVLKNIYLNLNSGQNIALVGPTGCGKSTIAKLIVGIYSGNNGTILFDGTPIEKMPRSILTSSIAIVEQDPFLFAGTARENLTLFNPLIPESEVIRAAKDACIHEEIMQREGGYEMEIEENGMNLSGGQRQRFELARALVKNPSILILDESTSALDSNTEAMVMQNIRQRGCTLLIVAHRLSTIRFCDQIVVMNMGEIASIGTHDELMLVPGIYRDLIESETK